MAEDSSRDLVTAAARIKSVLEEEEARGRHPGALADLVGCSRPTLLNWASGRTDINQVGIGYLLKFCEVTGVNWRWIMYGEAPRIVRYAISEQVQALAQKLAVMESKHPDHLKVVGRMIDAAADEAVAGSEGDPPLDATPTGKRPNPGIKPGEGAHGHGRRGETR